MNSDTYKKFLLAAVATCLWVGFGWLYCYGWSTAWNDVMPAFHLPKLNVDQAFELLALVLMTFWVVDKFGRSK